MKNSPRELITSQCQWSRDLTGGEEEVQARHPGSVGDMQLHVYNKSPHPEDSLPVVCDTLLCTMSNMVNHNSVYLNQSMYFFLNVSDTL